jgi:transmembrane sensor
MNREQLQETQRVARLIIGFIQRDLTQEERKELDDWIGINDSNLKLFERLIDESKREEAMIWFEDLDERAAFQNVRLQIKKQNRELIIHQTKYAIAALIVIAAGLGSYRYIFHRYFVNPAEVTLADNKRSIDLSSRDVILTTGSGEKLNLKSQQIKDISIGNNITIQQSNNRLIYSKKNLSTTNSLFVPEQTQYQIVLSDGTRVRLNALSSLQYPTSFNEKTRTVTLEGEGYFEVAKNKTNPFFVQCGNVIVRVIGTHFNINAYKNNEDQKVSLLEGEIEIKTHSRDKLLQPGQEAFVAGENILVERANDINSSIAWTKGIFNFNKNSIVEVMLQITQWYNVQVRYEGKTGKKFTGQIYRTSTLGQVLNMLELSSGVHFSVEGKTITVHSQ